MIQRRRGLFLVAALTIVIALVVTFPARVAYQWFSSPLLAMSGISGTVWSGTAREFSTNGVYLQDLQWRIRPLRLFTGKIAYSISASPVSGFLESDIAIGLDGTTTLTDLSAALPLQMMESAAKVPGLRGQASLQFERVRLEKGRAAATSERWNLDLGQQLVRLESRREEAAEELVRGYPALTTRAVEAKAGVECHRHRW